MYARNYGSYIKELYIRGEQSIDGTRTIYISDANGLYMVDARSICGRQTVYIW